MRLDVAFVTRFTNQNRASSGQGLKAFIGLFPASSVQESYQQCVCQYDRQPCCLDNADYTENSRIARPVQEGIGRGEEERLAETTCGNPSNEVEILPAERFDDIGHIVTFGRKS